MSDLHPMWREPPGCTDEAEPRRGLNDWLLDVLFVLLCALGAGAAVALAAKLLDG